MVDHDQNPYEVGQPVQEGPSGGIAIWLAFGLLGFVMLGFFGYSMVWRRQVAQETAEAARLDEEYAQKMLQDSVAEPEATEQ